MSLVCDKKNVPKNYISCDITWRGFRVYGTLDFSLTGIISKLSSILVDNSIGIFVVSTYNTDYILIKEENFEKAIIILKNNGYLFHE